MTQAQLLSFPARLHDLAREKRDGPAVMFIKQDGSELVLSWTELDLWATQVAHLLIERGAKPDTMIVINLPNCLEHIVSAFGIWQVGACAVPVSYGLPEAERDRTIGIAEPSAVIADRDGCVTRADIAAVRGNNAEPLPDVISQPGKAICSGGSTGTPKLIVDPNPWAAMPGVYAAGLSAVTGMQPGMRAMLPGPLYHNLPFTFSCIMLYEGASIVLFERFDARQVVDVVKRHGIEMLALVPTMMQRMARLPGLDRSDLASVKAIFHTASVCPEWVKRAWIDLVGAEAVYEAFAATEAIGHSGIRGDEWLEHPGSVGRPTGTDLRITRADGTEAETGEVGEIFFRSQQELAKGYVYVGAPPATTTEDGFTSLGDMGWLDEDGYLYIADRRVDLIISGGANIFPAEVEAVLTDHLDVQDAAVIGLPDPEWGKRVHAIVQTTADEATLDAHCREHLAAYKVPRSYEFVSEPLRNEAGKLRRTALVAERT